jgi:hypothetical protein
MQRLKEIVEFVLEILVISFFAVTATLFTVLAYFLIHW